MEVRSNIKSGSTNKGFQNTSKTRNVSNYLRECKPIIINTKLMDTKHTYMTCDASKKDLSNATFLNI